MKILLITDLFPPDSGGRADKMLRHVKYAGKRGIQMDVLCPATLHANASHSTGIGAACCFRVKPFLYRSLSSLKWQEGFGARDAVGRLLLRLKIPAGYLRWLPSAYKKAVKLLSSGEYSGFITVSNPMGIQLLGLALKRRFPQIGWVAEMRDPLVGYYRSRHSETLNKKFESLIAKKADGIAEWLDFSPSPMTERHNSAKRKHRHIPIVGYDPDEYRDLLKAEVKQHDAPLRLVYTGGYYGESEQWQAFFAAMAAARKSGMNLVFEHYGDWTDEQQRLRMQHGDLSEPTFVLHGRQKKQICVAATNNADALLYFLKESEENMQRISSKFYDYTAAKRPILSMSPRGSLLAERLAEYCPELTLLDSADAAWREKNFYAALALLQEKYNEGALKELLNTAATDLSCDPGEQIFIDLVFSTVKS